MRIKVGNSPLDVYSGDMSFSSLVDSFITTAAEHASAINRALTYEMHDREDKMFMIGAEAGIMKGLKSVKGVVGKGTTSIGHKVTQALNWLAENLSQLWDSLMKYDKKYKDLEKNIKAASEKLQTGSIGEMAKYSFYDIDVDALKKAVAFLDFKTFCEVKVEGNLMIGSVFSPDLVSRTFDGEGDKSSELNKFLSDATKLRKKLEDVGQEGLIYKIFSSERFRNIKSDYKGDGDKDGMIERFSQTIIGDKVEIEGPDFVTAAARYLSIVNKIAGDKMILKNLKKSGDELKQLTKRLSSVIKRAASPVSSVVNSKISESADKKEEARNNKLDQIEKEDESRDVEDQRSDADKEKAAKAAGKQHQQDEDKYKDMKGEITACVTVIGSVVTNTFMTTTKATLSVYKKILDDAYTCMSYIHSL